MNYFKANSVLKALGISILILLSFNAELSAQYFGRNKPSYKTFNFKVYQTPHFEIYHYLKNDSVLKRMAQFSEQWYQLHQKLFKDTFKTRNSIILYTDHADFQQTNAISGIIDVGTGGVTEAIKNRVVIPMASSYAQTDHVLGHELVHAFQYHKLFATDTSSLSSIRNLPLWMVEGMAEYFSLGGVDANTSMWMRDAIVNNDFPTLAQMSQSYRYFPYRFGQCFWSMVGKTWGDSIIVPLFEATARMGYPMALKYMLGVDENTLSGLWKSALVSHYQKYLDIGLTIPVGRKILFTKNAGDMNISPVVSPDGKYVIFLSERDVFTFDLYLADAHTGQIIRKLSSTVHNNEIDAFNYIESSGTWSPDGKRFAFTVFSEGRNKLVVVDVKHGRIRGEFDIPGVPSFSNPAWSPVDNQVVVSGMVEGQNDLFLFDLKTHKVTQLTNDAYAYMQPSWSASGKRLLFSTDRNTGGVSAIDPQGSMNIGMMDLDTRAIKVFHFFPGAKNLNPVFSPDDKDIFFLSNRDGFRNMYKYNTDSDKLYQETKFFTGISGITEYSPAISIARNIDLVNYSYYYGGKYSVYSAAFSDFKPFEVNRDSVNFDAATLPPLQHLKSNIVDRDLSERDSLKMMSDTAFKTVPYKPKFRLDYISNVDIGVSTNRFTSGMAGSVYAIFSDIVGQNQMFATLALNGQVYDFGGQLAYLNTKHKINWGASVSHIPYTYTYQQYSPELDSLSSGIYLNYPMYVYRIFEDKLSLFGMRPLSQTRRIEFGVSTAWYYERLEKWNQYYDASYYYVGEDRTTEKTPPGYKVQTLDLAYVTDNSYFGMTAPMRGERYRFETEKYFGAYDFFALLADYRRYIYVKPLTIAFRGLHYGFYGHHSDQQSIYNYLYLGYPWYIRGYDYNTFSKTSIVPDSLSVSVNDLTGSKMGIFNFELRMPLSGPKKIALIKSDIIYSDLSLFADAGIAWSNSDKPVFKWKKEFPNERIPLVSFGASLRINLFGYMVIEPYYAFPMQYGGFKNPVFGVNFQPGW